MDAPNFSTPAICFSLVAACIRDPRFYANVPCDEYDCLRYGVLQHLYFAHKHSIERRYPTECKSAYVWVSVGDVGEGGHVEVVLVAQVRQGLR